MEKWHNIAWLAADCWIICVQTVNHFWEGLERFGSDVQVMLQTAYEKPFSKGVLRFKTVKHAWIIKSIKKHVWIIMCIF